MVEIAIGKNILYKSIVTVKNGVTNAETQTVLSRSPHTNTQSQPIPKDLDSATRGFQHSKQFWGNTSILVNKIKTHTVIWDNTY